MTITGRRERRNTVRATLHRRLTDAFCARASSSPWIEALFAAEFTAALISRRVFLFGTRPREYRLLRSPRLHQSLHVLFAFVVRQVKLEPVPMQLFIRDVYRTFPEPLDVTDQMSVSEVKEIFSERESMPTNVFVLKYGGKHLKDTRTLGSCGITNEATLFLAPRNGMRGGMQVRFLTQR